MIECSTQQVIQVVNPCNASTDWQNNPGSCRLRIKNYNAAAWAGACPACIVSGLPDWKGEFSVFYPGFAGTSEIYSPAAGLSIGGKVMCANPHVTSNFGVLEVFGFSSFAVITVVAACLFGVDKDPLQPVPR